MTTIATPVSGVTMVPATPVYGENFRMDDNRPDKSSSLPPPASAPLSVRAAYPSDLTDAQWRRIEPLLPERKTTGRTGRPPRYSLRELLNGILYAQRTGCAWRYLPRDLPHWTSVYAYWQKWTRDGTLTKVLASLRLTSNATAAATDLMPFPEVVTSPGTVLPAATLGGMGSSRGAEAATPLTATPRIQAPSQQSQKNPQQRQKQRRRVIVAVRRSSNSSPVFRRPSGQSSIVASRGSAEPMLLRGSKGGSADNSGSSSPDNSDENTVGGSGDLSPGASCPEMQAGNE